MSGKPRFLPPHQKSVIKTRRPSFSPLSVFWEEKSEILEGKSGKYCIIAKILFLLENLEPHTRRKVKQTYTSSEAGEKGFAD